MNQQQRSPQPLPGLDELLARYGRPLDVRMGNPQRFVKGYDKDFFALFDPKTLPEGVLK